MKNITSFDNFLNESQLQDDYRKFFSKLLDLYGVNSPAQFKNKEELAAKFYKDIDKGWSKGNGLTKYGKKLMEADELELVKESKLQDNYRDFFYKLLDLYGVKSPLEFKHKEKLSEKFYKDVQKGWINHKGLTEYGKKLMEIDKLEDLKESVKINEEKVVEFDNAEDIMFYTDRYLSGHMPDEIRGVLDGEYGEEEKKSLLAVKNSDELFYWISTHYDDEL